MSHGVDLELGVYSSVPSDLPKEAVRDALAVNLGDRCGASISGQGLRLFEPSENVWPLVSSAQSNGEEEIAHLAVDFSFLQSPKTRSLLRIFGMEKLLILGWCPNGWLPSSKVLLPLLVWQF